MIMINVSAKMKKAELSFSVVIAAIIALLVFVVLVIIFNKQLVALLRPITEAITNIGGIGGEIGK